MDGEIVVARRRQWTAAEKAALLAEIEATGGQVSVVAAQPLARQLGISEPGGHQGRLRDGLEPVRHRSPPDPLTLCGRLGAGFVCYIGGPASEPWPEIGETLPSRNFRGSVINRQPASRLLETSESTQRT